MSDTSPRGEHEHGGERPQSGPHSHHSHSTHQRGPATSSDATGHGHHARKPGGADHAVGGHDKHSGHSVEMFSGRNVETQAFSECFRVASGLQLRQGGDLLARVAGGTI